MIKVYGIRNCDTCRKALKWLEAKGLSHEFHDFRVDGLAGATVATFIDKLGVEVLVNRRSTSWRALDEKGRSVFAGTDNKAVAAALVDNPTLIKRPVFEFSGNIINGFTEAQKSALSAG